MPEPTRILEDPDAPEQLRSLLVDARTDGLDASGVARVRAGLEQSIGPAGYASAGSGVGLKLLAALAVGGALVGGLILFAGEEAPAPPAVAERPVLVEPAPAPQAPSPVVVAPPIEEEIEAPIVEVEPEPAPAKPKAEKPSPAPGEEFELLLSARRALGESPARALKLTRRHARNYPRSALAEEREVIAILALVKLDRGAEAERRGKAFLAAHPGSSHRSAVEGAMRELQP